MGSFFIDRPVFAAVIAIIITLGGLVALTVTPIAQYPDIAPPTVQVAAFYPGATAEVVANTVAAPIEQQVNGVDNMSYMSSTSASSGNMSLTVTFEPGTDPDMAQVNVQNRVNQALSLLPDVVSQQGVLVQKRSQSFMMVISVYSPDDRYDPVYLGNYANLYILDPIKRIPGANLSSMFPQPDIAMRIWLRPDRLAQLGLSAQDVAGAVQEQNKAFGVGSIGQSPSPKGTQQSFVVTAKGMLSDPEEFENIIIRTESEGSALVRLKDIARVGLGAKDYSVNTKVNGKQAVAIVVYQQPGANAIETSNHIHELLTDLKQSFPQGLDYKVVLDTSEFTKASIEKVIHTFFEAVILVVLVVFLFLQSFRATLIPILAVPISIIGTYTGIYALGFSTNMLTLFGMILAIGLVVDDAIIMVENVEHNMSTLGLTPMDAAKKAMSELTGALIAIVLVLGAVFLPVAFMGGMTGTLYKQFAVTIAISMVLSGVVALTLSPALAARILKPGHGDKKGFFRWFENRFSDITNRYTSGVRWLINHKTVGIGLFAGLLVLVVFLFRVVPGSFVPEEDQGYLFVGAMLPDASSLERTTAVCDQAVTLAQSNPAMGDITQIGGFSLIDGSVKDSAGLLFAALKPYQERDGKGSDAFSVQQDMAQRLFPIKEGLVFPVNPPSIPGLGSTGGFEFYVQSKGGGSAQELEKVVKQLVAEAGKRPELTGVSTTFSASQQQLYLDLDRAQAELLGVSVSTAFSTLQSYFGSAYLGQFLQYGRLWQVIQQAEPEYRSKPSDLEQIYLQSNNGNMVPLSAMATAKYVAGPSLLPRFNGFPAAKLNGSQAAGYSSGQAIKAMEELAKQVLPDGYDFAWSGQAFEEKKAGNTSILAFTFGLIMVFLILSAQYEKWSLPIGVVLAVPFALCGALLMTWIRGLENDVYFQVGLVTLVGLSAKNAILIIEFAAENLKKGMSAADAAVEAARLRLRPIVMTSMAFILGCVPMATAHGAGANSLRAIGTGVIGGMLASTLVASFFVPLFFVILEEASSIFSRKKRLRYRLSRRHTMNNRYLATCAMLLCLTGCSIGPDYIRPEVAEYANWQLEYQGDEKLSDEKWWQQFGDPVLDQLIEEGVRNNLDLKTAAARVDQYLGMLDTTRSQYFPQIGAGFDAGGKREAGQTTELYTAALTASWELDLWGRVRRSSEAAQARILATEAGRQGVLMTLVTNVASGYITLLGLDQQLEIARATEAAYLESLRLFELRYKYGTVSQLEVSQVRSQYELAGQSIAAYQSQIRQQENLLSLLLGKVPGQIPRGKGIESLTAPAIPAGLPSQLLERRPDIIQAEQELIAANANIGAAKAEYFPRISLTGTLGVASDDIGRLFASGSGIWSAAGAATMPLLNFGKISGQVRQAEAIEQQALYSYQQAILSSFRDVEDALVKSSKGEEQLKAQERQVGALEDYARLSHLQFDAGTSSYLQVLDAERSLFSGKLSMTQTRYEQLIALISVYKAMGGGWVEEADRLADEKGKQAE